MAQRVYDLGKRAAVAQERRDVASATAVFNLAALLASDCGIPNLARAWCHRLAAVALAHDSEPQHALEPIVNLARLHIRAGDGAAAWTLLETLFQAIDTRTDTMIDGLTIPAARLTDPPGAHTKARTWLWAVLLGTGAHALATAGRWDEASHRLAQYKGIGARMLDGRQINVIAHAAAGRYQQARAMLGATHPGEPWENAVTACLYLHVPADNPADLVSAALTAYRALGPAESGLAVFHTRLGLTFVDALDAGHPDGKQIAVNLIRHAANDGYAARDLLAHPACLSIATSRQIGQLTNLASECGLGLGTISAAHLATLNRALDTAESVIKRQNRRQARQLA
ncbi:hypothetical protein [Micromonospora echinaurantiaca]|uniref:hypothetical protein n=1 Tax=Micromonospora echinaurantiaca TaxID=47857 RepID=UPI00379C1D72